MVCDILGNFDKMVSSSTDFNDKYLTQLVCTKVKDLKLSDEAESELKSLGQQKKEDILAGCEPFLTHYQLAQCASDVYDHSSSTEVLKNLSNKPKPWQVLTEHSASDGYFGRAYWYPEHQQVVIAHRGTESNGIDKLAWDLWADVKGVYFNKYISQINSAASFAFRIRQFLKAKEKEHGLKCHFQLYITGHSLGGWLAQITAFVVKYLDDFNSKFHLISDFNDGYHAHTVVFDSPGCLEMLEKIVKDIESLPRYKPTFRNFLGDLDITSYLSAPNLVNTCNQHIGRVVRVISKEYPPDNSYTNWIEYNQVTHNIKNILQAIGADPDGTSFRKEVLDWPIRKGIFQRAEYNNFFKWASQNKIKNLDSNETTTSYYRYNLRYQTAAYYNNQCNANVFTKEERDFLVKYDIVGDTGDLNIPSTTKKILATYQINCENQTIKCHSYSELRMLIQCVKRLMELYADDVKKIRESKNSTEAYLRKSKQLSTEIQNNKFQFNACCRDFQYFENILRDEQNKVYQLKVPENPIIRFVMLNRALGNLNTNQDQVLFLQAEKLIKLNGVSLNDVLETRAIKLVLIECNNVKDHEAFIMILESVLSSLLARKKLKIILVAQNGELSRKLSEKLKAAAQKFDNSSLYEEKKLENFSWNDLSKDLKESVGDKVIVFQRHSIQLKRLLTNHQDFAEIIDSETLIKLVSGNPIGIGDKHPTFSFYNESSYIKRSFKVKTTETISEAEFIQSNANSKIVIISDRAGMGKSTILSRLFQLMKEKYEDTWIVRINLNDHTQIIKDFSTRSFNDSLINDLINLLQNSYLKLDSEFEKKLFRHFFNSRKVIMMFDGFNEISSINQMIVNFFKFIQPKLKQLWVATRPNLQQNLEKKLGHQAYMLQPFSEANQIEFLSKFWFNLMPDNHDLGIAEKFASSLINLLKKSLCCKEFKVEGFTENPLHARMLAEIFQKDFEDFSSSSSKEPVLQSTINLKELYEQFVQRKYGIYQEEKLKNILGSAGQSNKFDPSFSEFIDVLEYLALDTLFQNQELTELQMNKSLQELSTRNPNLEKSLDSDHQKLCFEDYKVKIANLKKETESRFDTCGIIYQIKDDQPYFIHHTFAEFFVGSFFAKLLEKIIKNEQKMSKIMNKVLAKFLTSNEYQGARAFFNSQIKDCKNKNGERNIYSKDCIMLKLTLPNKARDTAKKEGNTHIENWLQLYKKEGPFSWQISSNEQKSENNKLIL